MIPSTQQRQLSGQSSSADGPSLPSRPGSNGTLRRRPSFNFLRRSKSTERAPTRSVSGRKLTKKQRSHVREQEMLKEQIPPRPPIIPDLPKPPALQSFGGEGLKPDSPAIISNRTERYGHHPRAVSSISKVSMDQPSSKMYPDVPIPPIPREPAELNGDLVNDPYARTESMTNRGRYSYASSVGSTINNPRKMRRRRDAQPFNILIIGARHAGKTSFIEFLRKSLALPPRKQRPQFRDDAYNLASPVADQAFPSFTSQYLETDIEGQHIGVTLWDSKGLEKSIVDLQLREISHLIESKFHDTMTEELKVIRSPGVRDTHIHCVFLLLDPLRLDNNIASTRTANVGTGNSLFGSSPNSNSSALDEKFDLQVFRALQSKTTVIPIIAKADILTSAHMAHLKRAVWDSLKRNNLENIATLGLNDTDSDNRSDTTEADEQQKPQSAPGHDRNVSMTSHLESPTDSEKSFSASEFDLARPSKNAGKPSSSTPGGNAAVVETPVIPMSIISPDPYEPDVVGRKFPWGMADPLDASHCDFTRLKDSIFVEWREELRELSREQFYEGWRSERLNSRYEKPVVQVKRTGGAKTFGGRIKH